MLARRRSLNRSRFTVEHKKIMFNGIFFPLCELFSSSPLTKTQNCCGKWIKKEISPQGEASDAMRRKNCLLFMLCFHRRTLIFFLSALPLKLTYLIRNFSLFCLRTKAHWAKLTCRKNLFVNLIKRIFAHVALWCLLNMLLIYSRDLCLFYD